MTKPTIRHVSAITVHLSDKLLNRIRSKYSHLSLDEAIELILNRAMCDRDSVSLWRAS